MRKLIALTLVVSSLAFAQTAAPKKPVKVQEVDFLNGSLIDGEREIPFEQRFTSVKPPKFKSLIKERLNFDDKLMESVNEL